MTFLSPIYQYSWIDFFTVDKVKTRKMLEGHVQVRQDIDMVITPFQIGLTC